MTLTLPRARARTVTFAASVGLLVIICLLSLGIGAQATSPGAALHALFDPASPDAIVVRGLRLPRTLTGLAVGAALGLAGTVMQNVTRNPLADPGLLGVNAGASLAAVTAISWLGVTNPLGFVWFAFIGSAVATVLVYAVAARGRSGATPFRLALAGAALTAAATSLVSLVLLTNRTALDEYRFWSVGSLSDPDAHTLVVLVPFLVAGVLCVLASARTMNALALGEDAARGLGVNVTLARIVLATVVVLLCGAATALAGPIAFIGLGVAHIARRLAGPDARWALAYSAVLGPVLLLAADIVGRVVDPPGELQAGIVVAFLGAPVMIAVVRRGQVQL